MCLPTNGGLDFSLSSLRGMVIKSLSSCSSTYQGHKESPACQGREATRSACGWPARSAMFIQYFSPIYARSNCSRPATHGGGQTNFLILIFNKTSKTIKKTFTKAICSRQCNTFVGLDLYRLTLAICLRIGLQDSEFFPHFILEKSAQEPSNPLLAT